MAKSTRQQVFALGTIIFDNRAQTPWNAPQAAEIAGLLCHFNIN
jgi:hypothetical protein